MQKYYDCGIDLGTTNSCLAIPDNDHGFEIIDNQADRMSVTPSAVLINGKGRMLIGQRAYNSQKVEDLAIQFKRQMGLNKTIHFSSANVDKMPEELSSEILKQLRNDAETRLNHVVENVVITVPAAFKTLQSEATNKAGKMAGFKNIILLQEPIAAAVAYGAKPDAKNKNWMVFDYGGGTLDVAIISTLDNRLTVENSEGDNYFGGSDIDRIMLHEIVIKRLKAEGYHVDELFDESTPTGKSMARKIQLDCENCKIELSNRETAILEIFDIDDDEGEPIEFECEITRSELEALISDTVERSIVIAKKALDGTDVNAEQLDKILLVGGSTFIPLVRRRLTEEFGVDLDSSLNPMTVVAAGAALYASTSVIDVEEEVEPTSANNAIISLTYDPISSEETVNVIGKVTNINDVSIDKIKIDCSLSGDFSGLCWTSGWIELLDHNMGIFDVDVLLQKGTLNHFRVVACDANGSEIVIENPLFDIKHNETVLKMSAPPATMSIGVQIRDAKTGYDILYHVIKKNSPLPAQNDRTFKLSRDIDPSRDDCITIKIWEGENVQNPEANFPAGAITVQSYAMDRMIPKGTEIELTIIADENRNIRVSGYIPDFDFIIPEETLRSEAKVDLEERMDVVEKKIQQSEVSIQKLKDQGVDVSDLEDELESVKAGFDDTYGKVDSDEAAVNGYVDRFYDVESKIIKEERRHEQHKADSKNDDIIKEAREQVNNYGDDDANAAWADLEEAYELAETAEEKNFVATKMRNLGFEAMTNNYGWLKSFFSIVLSKPETKYTNAQKAEYWKSQAYLAMDSKNTSQLRKAVFELLELMTSSANQAVSSFGADLTV
ncbi:Hsp70 family protein [Ruminococcus sp.]|uniref:Hsp70 family protein n=1 Tax=Ruminococcus sp. TaxID=41978 RepID=UPI002E81457C|nr:Hsp70 family protein [Ruminococcus sp.]MEE3491542.1 Hsp70 family protein [Ruminococcus sp.]